MAKKKKDELKKQPAKHCGFVAIVGRPNVGKSTLLNYFLGFKLAITSRKPQTTRHRILGISTKENYQIIFMDTPGVNKKPQGAMNRYLNRTANTTIKSVDLALLVTDRTYWNEEDEKTLQMLKAAEVPIIWVINKVDRCQEKTSLLPHVAKIQEEHQFQEVFFVSATKGNNLDLLERSIVNRIPQTGEFYYAEEQKTDKNDLFIAKEYIREKLMRQLGDELPYSLTVDIEQFEQEEKLLNISAVVWVNKAGHKPIVIGHKGSRLKKVGSQARLDMEKYFGQKVFLRLWVKVRENWADDKRSLASLGYVEDI